MKRPRIRTERVPKMEMPKMLCKNKPVNEDGNLRVSIFHKQITPYTCHVYITSDRVEAIECAIALICVNPMTMCVVRSGLSHLLESVQIVMSNSALHNIKALF